MPGSRLSPPEMARIDRMQSEGYGRMAITKAVGRDYRTVKAYLDGVEYDNGKSYAAKKADEKLPDVKRPEDLSPEARRAQQVFSYHRQRFYGRVSRPWNDLAADRVVELLESPRKEYVVINVPPGVGKTTTFTHDLPAWVTTLNRQIRGLMGHRAEREARKYTNRLRRTLERKVPYQPDDALIGRGLAMPAEATLLGDYGRFKPNNSEVWRAEEFVVAQVDDLLVAEKEMTWTSYGMDSAQIGNRFDLIVWDDLVTRSTVKTMDAITNQREWWTDEAETRLEPGGLLILVGQRMSPHDLYRFALDMATGDDEWDDADVGDVHEIDLGVLANVESKKYVHVKFPAHDDLNCQGRRGHRKDSPAWPDGCLLDPLRLTYRELSAVRANQPGKYQIVYQQNDIAVGDVLVPEVWVSGGRDPETGIEYSGCWNENRGLAQMPTGLVGPFVSVVTVDPSVARWWAFQWWVVHVATGRRYLMDCEKRRMSAEALLDYIVDEQTYVGIMEEWQSRSRQLGYPITHWIVEKVAAFKHLLVYDASKRWAAANQIEIVAHETQVNKNDPKIGVTSVQQAWRLALVDLPSLPHDPGRGKAMDLVFEITRYRLDEISTGSDDQVMANWMLEWHLPWLLLAAEEGTNDEGWVPSWLQQPA